MREIERGAEIMWPVVRRRAMEEKLSLQEFHDLEEVEDGEEEDGDYLEEEEEGEDVEKGLKGNFHYSPSLIQKRGVSTLHQVNLEIILLLESLKFEQFRLREMATLRSLNPTSATARTPGTTLTSWTTRRTPPCTTPPGTATSRLWRCSSSSEPRQM